MRRYALLVTLLVMLWGTEARADPFQFHIFGYNDSVSEGLSVYDLTPVVENRNTFQTFSYNVLASSLPNPQVDKLSIDVLYLAGTSDTNSFHIDNLQFTVDGATDPTTIRFDGGGPTGIGDPTNPSNPFYINTVGTWSVSQLLGDGAPSIFGVPTNSDAILSRFTFVIPAIPGTQSLVDGQSFTFHSVSLASYEACDINGCGNGGGGNGGGGNGVPEPASLLLLGAGLAGIGIWRRKATKIG